MIIKVLGSGCAKCNQLENLTKEVLKEMGIDARIEHVKDIKNIMQYPIMATPGLVIDEELVLSGKLPDKAKLNQIIVNALAKEDKIQKQP
jgi:small redox-active disulfide protein 2